MKIFPLLCLFLLAIPQVRAQFSTEGKNYQKQDGFFTFYYEESSGKMFLEVKELEKEFLYVYSLSSGIGSNDIGLDRGQLGSEQVVFFRKAGDKLLLIQPNLKFRALTDNTLEKKSVEQAFAKSVLSGFKILEHKQNSYFIEITEFLMQDAHGVAARLKSTNQGTYSTDTTKSAISMERTRAFPKNVEFDVILTFKGEPGGNYIRSVTPNPALLTVSQHHSFIELPDGKYKMREYDPRSGSYPFSYYDYASPVYEPLQKQYITRHRLEKKNPGTAVSEAVKPIIYYLDNGTPEPVRTALLEGGRWWNEAFEALGYSNAFQLKMLPEDADPLDARYHVIQWVHRSTRGWSYGSSITDPRTGEIIKGHVSLGSLRIRQDFLIAQALMNKPFAEGDDSHEPMLQLALARIRQLSAHEIGHTLGFAHNFAASSNGRASVMDYPHPQVLLRDGAIDFSEAYDEGIGEWDKITVAYSYTDFPEATDERAALNGILDKARQQGLLYISDQDARPQGGAHALGHLWDNGAAPAEELDKVLQLRKAAIANFSEDNIRKNEAFSVLEDVFAPLYLYHRYQTEAVAKLVGGIHYTYAVKGDSMPLLEVVTPDLQRNALDGMLKTLQAEVLAIPKEKLGLFPPRAMGYERGRESLQGRTGVTFDALSAAETAADMSLELLLHPERTSRLIQQKSLDPEQLGLPEVLTKLVEAILPSKLKPDPYLDEVQTTIAYRMLYHIMNLAAAEGVHPQVNAAAHSALEQIRLVLGDKSGNAKEMKRRINAFYEHPENFKLLPAPKIPDGSPIGMDCMY